MRLCILQEGLKKKSREVDKIKEDTEKKVQELSENINKTKVREEL